MTTASKTIGLETLPLRYPQLSEETYRTYAFRRLTEVFKSAKVFPFDDSSRFVFFSDLHRGDNSRIDAFARNKGLFLRALTYYFHEGFTYVEVGDGDELWKNRKFNVIRRAHSCIFDLMHKFHVQDRLHLVVGNHDISGSRHHPVEKDGIVAHEGLIMRHARTGQQIFVAHGHQADFKSDRLYVLSRLIVRYIGKYLQNLGLIGTTSQSRNAQRQREKIEERIINWIQAKRQIVICGHTHQARYAQYGAPPYFNTGSGVYPGYITGLELQDGRLALVRWSTRHDTKQGDRLPIERELVTLPMKLQLLGA